MRNPQVSSFILLAISVVFFLFSLALLPPVELYCSFRRPAVALLSAQILLLVIVARRRTSMDQRALVIGAYVFLALGVLFNIYLMFSTGARC